MKKLLILFFISIGCFGQLVRNPVSSGGGTVGVAVDSFTIEKNGVSYETNFIEKTVFGFYDLFFTMKSSISVDGSQVVSGDVPFKGGFLPVISIGAMAEDASFSINSYNAGGNARSPNIGITSIDNTADGALLSYPYYYLRMQDTAGSGINAVIVQYNIGLCKDSSINITPMTDQSGNTHNGLIVDKIGLVKCKDNDGVYDVLNSKNTLSGTVYVKDTNNVIKSLTFTNGLLTASDLGDFAGVFESSETNLTMTNYKNSPDYAEFLEFQKYLNMKKQLAKK